MPLANTHFLDFLFSIFWSIPKCSPTWIVVYILSLVYISVLHPTHEWIYMIQYKLVKQICSNSPRSIWKFFSSYLCWHCRKWSPIIDFFSWMVINGCSLCPFRLFSVFMWSNTLFSHVNFLSNKHSALYQAISFFNTKVMRTHVPRYLI